MVMQISDFGGFFNKLPDKIKKVDVFNDYDNALAELNEIVRPAFENSKAIIDTPYIEGLYTSSTIKRIVHDYKGSAIKTILDTINIIDKNSDGFSELITDTFEDITIKAVIDYKKLHILKYIEALNFFNEYARQWIVSVSAVALDKKNDDPKSINLNKSKSISNDVTIKQYTAYINNVSLCEMFAVTINLFAYSIEDFETLIKPLEGHIFNANDWSKTTTVTTNFRLDPFRISNRFITTWNPIYQVGLIINGWRARKYERNKADLNRLTLIVAGLQEQKTVNSDPTKKDKILNQIEYYSNQINKINIEIEKYEED
jgi:hypothetical protein